jgi:hypothetical protein
MTSSDWLFASAIIAGLGAIAPVIVEGWRRIKATGLLESRYEPDRQVDFESAERRISEASNKQSVGEVEDRSAAFRRILNFNERLPLRIVIATLPHPENEPLRTSVALEDLRASENVIRALSGSYASRADIVTAEDIDRGSPVNLALVGGRRNPIVREILGELRARGILDSDFVQVKTPDKKERWGLRLGGQLYVSPLFDQERDYKTDPTGYDAGFMDYGLLAKVTNPWNPDAKVLIISGVRALGTLGASQFLDDNADSLEAKLGDSDFAVVIKAVRDHPSKDYVFAEALDDPMRLTASDVGHRWRLSRRKH